MDISQCTSNQKEDVVKNKNKKIRIIAYSFLIVTILTLILNNPSKEEYLSWSKQEIINKTNNPLVIAALTISGVKIGEPDEVRDYGIFSIFKSTDIYGVKNTTLGLLKNFFILSKQTENVKDDNQLWKFNEIKAIIPQEEAVYEDKSGENNNYKEYAYNEGSLRIFVSPYTKEVIAFLVDTSKVTYRDLKNLKHTDEYQVYHINNFTVVCQTKPINQDTFNMLKSGTVSLASLNELLGKSSSKEHIHGVGATIYTYFPQGLCFSTIYEGTEVTLYPRYLNKPFPDFTEYKELYYFNQSLSYDDYIVMLNNMCSTFASKCVEQVTEIKSVIAGGKKSPDGTYVANILQKGGYWDSWIIIGRPQKAELRKQADYFISDFKWVDNNRLLYADMNGKFTIVDVASGKQSDIYNTSLSVTNIQFTITSNNIVRFTDDLGNTHEFDIPYYL